MATTSPVLPPAVGTTTSASIIPSPPPPPSLVPPPPGGVQPQSLLPAPPLGLSEFAAVANSSSAATTVGTNMAAPSLLLSPPPPSSLLMPPPPSGSSSMLPQGLATVDTTGLFLSGHPPSVPASNLMTNMYNLMMQVTKPEKHIQCIDKSIPPNRTLYINNLNDKIKTPKLVNDLTEFFKSFGPIRQIIAMRSFWRRGQAYIAFENQSSADRALEAMQGRIYEGKPMRINYARAESDCFTKEKGTFVEREKGPKKPRAVREREKNIREQMSQLQQQWMTFQQQQQELMAPGGLPAASVVPMPTTGTPTAEQENEEVRNKRKAISMQLKTDLGGLPIKQMKLENTTTAPSVEQAAVISESQVSIPPVIPSAAAAAATSGLPLPAGSSGSSMMPPPPPPDQSLGVPPGDASNMAMSGPSSVVAVPKAMLALSMAGVPSRTLFVELLPNNVQEATLNSLFSQVQGFEKVRLISAKNVAFIDYKTSPHAAAALQLLAGHEIESNYPMKITFARK